MANLGTNAGAKRRRAIAEARAVAVMPSIDAALEAGVEGLAGLALWLNDRNIAAPRGGSWRTETVRRVLQRLAKLGHPCLAPRTRSQGQFARGPSAPQYRQGRLQRRKAERTLAAQQ
jgi:hypothetical protein